MRQGNAGSRLRLQLSAGAIGSLLLFATLITLAVTAGGAPSSEPGQLAIGRSNEGATALPGGLDPMEVVRAVQRNTARAGDRHGEFELRRDSATGPAEGVGWGLEHVAGERVPGSPGAVTGSTGPAFEIGGTPTYGQATGSQNYPAVAFDGTNYLVVWEDWRGFVDGTYRIYGARVSTDGTVLDPAGIMISRVSHWDSPYSIAVTFGGTDYLVVWEDWRKDTSWNWSIRAARVTTDGLVLDPDGISVSAAADSQVEPAVASDGTGYLVVWQDRRSGSSYDIYSARVDPFGAVLDTAGIAISTAANDQLYPAVAFQGTSYLVAWQDLRSGSYYDIYGARVDTAGAVLDPGGIAISTAEYAQGFPAIGFDGTNCLVAWADYRSGYDYNILGTRVDSEGVVLDPGGKVISTAPCYQLRPAVVFDGANYFVTWDDWRFGCSIDSSGYDIFGARVSVGGTVLDPGGIAISTVRNDQFYPALAFGGANSLVVWMDLRNDVRGGTNYDIYGARVTPAGSVLDPSAISISISANNQDEPAIAFGGTNYFVVWEDRRSESYYHVYGARVSAGGTLLDPNGIAVSTAAYNHYSPAVAFDGTNYLVVWCGAAGDSADDIYAARVNTEGVVLDPAGIAISTVHADQQYPAAAFDGTNYLVVWEDGRRGSYYDIYGARVSNNGVVLDPLGIPISVVPYRAQYSPDVAFDGTNYLVVWYGEGSNWHIYAARVSVGGNVLDPAGIRLTTPTGTMVQVNPAVAFDGTNYLVVWDDNSTGRLMDIYGTRVSVGGTVLDPAGIAISAASGYQVAPEIAFDGSDYFVVWSDGRSGSTYDIYGTRVSTGGSVLDPAGIAISVGVGNKWTCPIAHGPSNSCLVAYALFVPQPYGSARIFGNLSQYPTPVAFSGVSISDAAGCVRLSWGMAVEASASGFVVERGDSPDGSFLPLEIPITEGTGETFSCLDCSVVPGGKYWYRIVLEGTYGNEVYGPLQVHVAAVPSAYALDRAYPNPFNPSCTIGYDIPKACRVSLGVFDVSGSLVRTLVEGWREPGVYREVWDGKRDDGAPAPSGIYLYRLEADDFVAARKMVLLR